MNIPRQWLVDFVRVADRSWTSGYEQRLVKEAQALLVDKRPPGDPKLTEKIVEDAVADARKRANSVYSSPSHLNDRAWAVIQGIARKKGPLSDAEMVVYMRQYDHVAKDEFLSLVFEVERLYTIIRHLADKDPS